MDEPAELSSHDLSCALLKKLSLSERRNSSLQDRIRELEKDLLRVRKEALISRDNQWLYFCNVCRRKTNQAHLRSHFVEWKETTMISMSFVRTIHLHERSHVLRRLYKHFFHWVHVASQSRWRRCCEPWDESREPSQLTPSQAAAQAHAPGGHQHWLLYGPNGRVSRADSDNASMSDGHELKERPGRWEEDGQTSNSSLETKPRAGLAKLWGMETLNTAEFM